MPSRAKVKAKFKEQLKQLRKYKKIDLNDIEELKTLEVRGDYVWVDKEKEETKSLIEQGGKGSVGS